MKDREPRPMAELLEIAHELATRPPTEDDLNAERRARMQAAARVRDRLPGFLRHAKGQDMLARVAVDVLKQTASAWRWGAGGLVFLGMTRIGKSTVAAWLFRRLLHEGWNRGGSDWELAQRLRWYSAEALCQARKEHPLGHGEAPEIVHANAASLLVIDDAGWDRDPTAVSSVLAARYEKGLPTLITSGKTLEELNQHYGAAVVRRIMESGGKRAVVVDCFPPPAPPKQAELPLPEARS